MCFYLLLCCVLAFADTLLPLLPPVSVPPFLPSLPLSPPLSSSLPLLTAREHIVGWYHTGPKLHPNDIAIHELIGKYCANPVSRPAYTISVSTTYIHMFVLNLCIQNCVHSITIHVHQSVHCYGWFAEYTYTCMLMSLHAEGSGDCGCQAERPGAAD